MNGGVFAAMDQNFHLGSANTKRLETARGTRPLRLPDFIVVGPPRTGTTWLDRVLRGHVGLPREVKETQFFAWNYELGVDWYAKFFRNCDPDQRAGEIAPTYFDKADARQRIAELIPGCKVVCSLRDPVERLYSQYKTWHRTALVRGPFEYDVMSRRLGADGGYASNVKAWQEICGAENVLVQFYEDLKSSRQSYIDTLCSFIDAPRIELERTEFARRKVNPSEQSPRSLALARVGQQLRRWGTRHPRTGLARRMEAESPLWRFFFAGGPDYPPLDPHIEKNLRQRLIPDVEELEQLLNRDLTAWKVPQPHVSG
jgi:Sulfotransferase domain